MTQKISIADRGQTETFVTTIHASELAIRATVTSIRTWLGEIGVADAACSIVELVMAEALNNICEHAYVGGPVGTIDISAKAINEHLLVIMRDHGHPQSGGKLPAGRLPSVSVPHNCLPEGGFGWFLIRELTDTQSYSRDNQGNRLELTLTLNRSGK